eukprot:TRINITY_DN8503_c0_g1_i6.p1 TRINITY_DN8503_c0_g1~~TRINITY_DN8503_c0_g1_i6.p1  ORF type:complete len:142 (+),score=32.39 TRINITY_DN8503_c0_g1_i6:93-518(+)
MCIRDRVSTQSTWAITKEEEKPVSPEQAPTISCECDSDDQSPNLIDEIADENADPERIAIKFKYSLQFNNKFLSDVATKPLLHYRSYEILKVDTSTQKTQRIESLINFEEFNFSSAKNQCCLLYTSPSPRDLSTSRMPSSA